MNRRSEILLTKNSVKAWCLCIDGIPEINCISHTKEKSKRLAEKFYQSHWSQLSPLGYEIRPIWVVERGVINANS